ANVVMDMWVPAPSPPKKPLVSLSPGVSTDARLLSVEVAACAKAQKWEAAVELVAANRGSAALDAWNSAVGACGRAAKWDRSLALLRSLKLARKIGAQWLEPSAVTLGACSLACEKGLQWPTTLGLLTVCRDAGLLGPPVSRSDSANSSTPRSRVGAPRTGSGGQLASITGAVRACERATQWPLALLLLPEMLTPLEGRDPNLLSFTAALRVCEQGHLGGLALQLLKEFKQQSMEPSTISCNAALAACAKSHLWEAALSTLSSAQQDGLEVNAITGTSVLSAFVGQQQQQQQDQQQPGLWTRALDLLGSLRLRFLEPNEFTFSTALRTCSEAGNWESSLGLLVDMLAQSVPANVFSCTAGLIACGEGLQWDWALQLLSWGRGANFGGLRPDLVSHNAATQACLRAGRWPAALVVREDLASRALRADEFSFVMAAGACEVSFQWELVLKLLTALKADRPGVLSAPVLHSTATACVASQQWELALDILLSGPLGLEAVFANDGRLETPPSETSVGVALTACAAGQLWKAAVALLQGALGQRLQASPRLCAATIHACSIGKFEVLDGRSPPDLRLSRRWVRALDLLRWSRDEGLVEGQRNGEVPEPSRDKFQKRQSGSEVQMLNAAIQACSFFGWEHSVSLLSGAMGQSLQSDTVSWNLVASTCDKQGLWQSALEVLHIARRSGMPGDIVGYNAALSACEQHGLWQRALQLLSESTDSVHAMRPSVISCNAAISACEKAGEWAMAFRLLGQACSQRLQPDAISFNAAVAACGNMGEWATALALIAQAAQSGLPPESAAFDMAVVGCERSQKWQVSVQLLVTSGSLLLPPSFIALSSAIRGMLGGVFESPTTGQRPLG
ncbi:unnamed protein product, partial [Polarella glacialis]